MDGPWELLGWGVVGPGEVLGVCVEGNEVRLRAIRRTKGTSCNLPRRKLGWGVYVCLHFQPALNSGALNNVMYYLSCIEHLLCAGLNSQPLWSPFCRKCSWASRTEDSQGYTLNSLEPFEASSEGFQTSAFSHSASRRNVIFGFHFLEKNMKFSPQRHYAAFILTWVDTEARWSWVDLFWPLTQVLSSS